MAGGDPPDVPPTLTPQSAAETHELQAAWGDTPYNAAEALELQDEVPQVAAPSNDQTTTRGTATTYIPDFGRHAGRSCEDVFRHEKNYVQWALRAEQPRGGLLDLQRWIRARMGNQDEHEENEEVIRPVTPLMVHQENVAGGGHEVSHVQEHSPQIIAMLNHVGNGGHKVAHVQEHSPRATAMLNHVGSAGHEISHMQEHSPRATAMLNHVGNAGHEVSHAQEPTTSGCDWMDWHELGKYGGNAWLWELSRPVQELQVAGCATSSMARVDNLGAKVATVEVWWSLDEHPPDDDGPCDAWIPGEILLRASHVHTRGGKYLDRMRTPGKWEVAYVVVDDDGSIHCCYNVTYSGDDRHLYIRGLPREYVHNVSGEYFIHCIVKSHMCFR